MQNDVVELMMITQWMDGYRWAAESPAYQISQQKARRTRTSLVVGVAPENKSPGE